MFELWIWLFGARLDEARRKRSQSPKASVKDEPVSGLYVPASYLVKKEKTSPQTIIILLFFFLLYCLGLAAVIWYNVNFPS